MKEYMIKNSTYMRIVIVLIFALTTLLYALSQSSEYKDLLQNIAYLIPPFLAVLAGLYAFKQYGMSSLQGHSLLFLTIGILLWFAGEITWTIYDFVLELDAFPSLADVFYLAAYPLLVFGLLREIRISKVQIDLKRMVVGLIAIFIFASINIYFGMIIAYDTEASLLENVFAMLYGVGDLTLLLISLYLLNIVFEYKGGKLFKPWLAITVGVFLMWVADIIFAIYTNEYEEAVGYFRYIDLLWMYSYLLFAYGFLTIGLILKKIQMKFLVKIKNKNEIEFVKK